MKSLLLIFCLTLSNYVLIAQDVCSELMKFSSFEKNNNRTMRMTSKTSMMGQSQIMERDKDGNMYQIMKMEMGDQKMQIESITLGSIMYTSQNGKEWQTRELDSMQLATTKNQWKNNQLNYFKNCEKKENETIEGKTFRVYYAEFDVNQMQEMMKTSKSLTEEEKQAMERTTATMSAMQMKMTMYINDNDDLAMSKTNMSMQGKDFEMIMTFEYDLKITVSPPPPPPPMIVPAPVKKKN
jgi:hypothetical protein